MTDSISELPPPPEKKPKSFALVLLLVFLMLAAIVLPGAYYLWLQQQNLAESVNAQSSRFKNQESAQAASLQALTLEIDRLKASNLQLQQLLQKSAEEQAFHAQKLAQLGGGNRSDWLLAEAEYLLRLANQRLLLEHDVKGSELVLSAADSVLKEIDDPALLPARVALAEEILALQTLPKIDIQGAYAKISSLSRAIYALPEKFAALEPDDARSNQEQPGKAQNPDSVWAQLAAELGKVLQVRRENEPVTPLMRPEEYYYLKHNLRLMYEQAALALLAREDTLFQDSIAKAADWLGTYFDAKNPRVAAQIETLDALAQGSLAMELPDISRSLKLVKARIEALYRNHTLDKETPAEDKMTEAPQT